MIVAATALAGPKPVFGALRPVLALLVATLALPLLQLIPLPPSWWLELPGRSVLQVPGQVEPWRPWTMVPGATRNAFFSLVVPATMLLLLTQLDEKSRSWLPAILLAFVTTAVVLGLLQFSGVPFNNPLLNDTPGLVSSIFANRNHFAVLVAIGCLIAPVWAFMDRNALSWRGPLAIGLVLLFILTILATGSRSGILVGAAAILAMLALIGRRLQRRFKRRPGWVFPALLIAGFAVMFALVWLSFAADRAVSVNRLLIVDVEGDSRIGAFPTVLAAIRTYMPFGSGFGGFDPIFRIHEPLSLLKLTYFNQAHNDYLGIALDGGVLGLTVLGAGVGWWLIQSVRVWRAAPDETVTLARLGSCILLLIFMASATDYPARTPTIMAIIVVAAAWLARGSPANAQIALPGRVSVL